MVEPEPEKEVMHEFHASTVLRDSPTTLKDVKSIYDNVIRNLEEVNGASIEVTVLIDMRSPDGISQGIVKDLSDNCEEIKITNYYFE